MTKIVSTPCSQGDSCDEHQYILTLLIITHLCILAENDLVSQGGGGSQLFNNMTKSQAEWEL